MRPLYALMLVLPLAACSSAVPLETESDRCNSLAQLSKVGQKRESIPAGTFRDGARIIKPGPMVTQDYRPDRLNVHVNDKGRIERFECG